MNFNFKNTSKSMKVGLAGFATMAAMFIPTLVQVESYTVKSGDTLFKIAQEHQITVDKIAQKNNLSNIHLISIGHVLELDDSENTQTKEVISTGQQATSLDASAGLSAEDAEAKEWIAQKESSGSYTAQNGQYYGRYQLTISYLNGDLSPENQEKVANAYVTGRYGSWSAAKTFWLANGWY